MSSRFALATLHGRTRYSRRGSASAKAMACRRFSTTTSLALGLVALEVRDHARAANLGAECLALAKRIGHARGSANALYVLGRDAVGRGAQVEGRDLLEKSLELYRQYATELVALSPDVIFTNASATVTALQEVTRTVPIVFASG